MSSDGISESPAQNAASAHNLDDVETIPGDNAPDPTEVKSAKETSPASAENQIKGLMKNLKSDLQLQACEELKSYAEKLISTTLRTKGIRALVTGRIKSNDSLKDKLERLGSDISLLTTDPKDCSGQKHVHIDIVGIRVALYFPAEQPEVVKILKDIFHHHSTRPWVRDSPSDSNVGVPLHLNLFGAYTATHLWLHAQDGDIETSPPCPASAQNRLFEVQLRSVLMDGWAEINEDMHYENTQGPLNGTELKMLDAVKGQIEVGELILEKLYIAHKRRIGHQDARFQSLEGLFEVLFDLIPGFLDLPPTETSNEGRDFTALLQFLKHLGLNTPRLFRELIDGLKVRDTLQATQVQVEADSADGTSSQTKNPYESKFSRMQKLFHPVKLTRGAYIIHLILEDALSPTPAYFCSKSRERILHIAIKNEWYHTNLKTFGQAMGPAMSRIFSSFENYTIAAALSARGPESHSQTRSDGEQPTFDQSAAECISEGQAERLRALWYMVVAGHPDSAAVQVQDAPNGGAWDLTEILRCLLPQGDGTNEATGLDFLVKFYLCYMSWAQILYDQDPLPCFAPVLTKDKNPGLRLSFPGIVKSHFFHQVLKSQPESWYKGAQTSMRHRRLHDKSVHDESVPDTFTSKLDNILCKGTDGGIARMQDLIDRWHESWLAEMKKVYKPQKTDYFADSTSTTNNLV